VCREIQKERKTKRTRYAIRKRKRRKREIKENIDKEVRDRGKEKQR
jgi:hypothetical protein